MKASLPMGILGLSFLRRTGMKSRYVGHDPELGKKFMSEHSGSVIGFGRSSQSESEPNQYQDLQEQFNEEATHRAIVAKSKQSPPQKSLSEEDHQLKLMGRWTRR
jgi:hypothetical protein